MGGSPVVNCSIFFSLIVKLDDLGAISPTFFEFDISFTLKSTSPSPIFNFQVPLFSNSII